MEITAETIKQNYPAIWWQIYRQGFKEAQESPEVQQQAAKKHLEHALTKPFVCSPAGEVLTAGASNPTDLCHTKTRQRTDGTG
jgi:hypothetical protein